MPIRIEKWYAVICPICWKKPDMGSDYTPLFETRRDAKEAIDHQDWKRLEECIADVCGEPCLSQYYHRKRAKDDSCGYGSCEICGLPRKERGLWQDAILEVVEHATEGTPRIEFLRGWGEEIGVKFDAA